MKKVLLQFQLSKSNKPGSWTDVMLNMSTIRAMMMFFKTTLGESEENFSWCVEADVAAAGAIEDSWARSDSSSSSSSEETTAEPLWCQEDLLCLLDPSQGSSGSPGICHLKSRLLFTGEEFSRRSHRAAVVDGFRTCLEKLYI